ncbi:uncharacterized protein FPRO_07956 [Fusarium proliferatum ET1]|uniref:Uncharacterized protein n=1 Tax=Fusarium proliferatum (strain ET1) TaxID=1227346 RepID=A0A1L7VRR7_FUSPR|nr:uncharacterized protein FPRO_07956 [Fusarium proliferatum ET1]CZR43128.1 uncharacterized protein FPRO_07956 [Fusarium proliferatum ET1]
MPALIRQNTPTQRSYTALLRFELAALDQKRKFQRPGSNARDKSSIQMCRDGRFWVVSQRSSNAPSPQARRLHTTMQLYKTAIVIAFIAYDKETTGEVLRDGGARLIRLKYISIAVTQPAHQTLMDSYMFVSPESLINIGFNSV